MSGTPTPGGRLPTILIVDDTPANLGVAAEHLEHVGYRVLVAQDGEEALERAQRVSPDIILLDVLMPGLDGFETCRRLKASDDTREIPVIFMTCLSEATDKLAGFEAGGVDFITKPFQIEELIARTKVHLALRETQKLLEARNAQLQQEVAARREKEAALRRIQDELEQRVQERTAELASANTTLKAEITERKRMEEERERLLASERAARREIERTSRLKDEFLSTLSHELRTPLTAILGWAQLLLSRHTLPQDPRRGVETIGRNARALAHLVDDLLDMSRIVSAQLRLDVRRVDPKTVLEAVAESVRPAADAKAIRLEQELDPAVGQLMGDPNRLQQIIWNLVCNAIKFTPHGGRVKVSLRQQGSNVQLTVSDTGLGIEPEFLPHVFEPFRQADASSTRRHGGLGLGLAIVLSLVELHGGTVEAASEGKDKGATFTVKLPREVSDAEARAATPRAEPRRRASPDISPRLMDLEGIRVLVVDDEPDTRELVGLVLGEQHAEVQTVGSAAEALAELPRFRPMVLVSDIGMPEEDGFSLIQKVRRLPREQGGGVPALALTAFASAEDRARAIREGYQMHLAKPVEPWDLMAYVASLASRTRREAMSGT